MKKETEIWHKSLGLFHLRHCSSEMLQSFLPGLTVPVACETDD